MGVDHVKVSFRIISRVTGMVLVAKPTIPQVIYELGGVQEINDAIEKLWKRRDRHVAV